MARTQRVTWEGIIQANADLQNARMMHNRETAMLNGYREQVNAYEERLVLKEVETR